MKTIKRKHWLTMASIAAFLFVGLAVVPAGSNAVCFAKQERRQVSSPASSGSFSKVPPMYIDVEILGSEKGDPKAEKLSDSFRSMLKGRLDDGFSFLELPNQDRLKPNLALRAVLRLEEKVPCDSFDPEETGDDSVCVDLRASLRELELVHDDRPIVPLFSRGISSVDLPNERVETYSDWESMYDRAFGRLLGKLDDDGTFSKLEESVREYPPYFAGSQICGPPSYDPDYIVGLIGDRLSLIERTLSEERGAAKDVADRLEEARRDILAAIESQARKCPDGKIPESSIDEIIETNRKISGLLETVNATGVEILADSPDFEEGCLQIKDRDGQIVWNKIIAGGRSLCEGPVLTLKRHGKITQAERRRLVGKLPIQVKGAVKDGDIVLSPKDALRMDLANGASRRCKGEIFTKPKIVIYY